MTTKKQCCQPVCCCRQDLSTATERELQSRGCLEYGAIAAELLDSYGIKQSLRVKDYYRGVKRIFTLLRSAAYC